MCHLSDLWRSGRDNQVTQLSTGASPVVTQLAPFPVLLGMSVTLRNPASPRVLRPSLFVGAFCLSVFQGVGVGLSCQQRRLNAGIGALGGAGSFGKRDRGWRYGGRLSKRKPRKRTPSDAAFQVTSETWSPDLAISRCQLDGASLAFTKLLYAARKL
jgi:hypothetical protein